MISPRKKRILIALYYDYHLFGYFKHLVPLLLRDGYEVTLLTCDVEIKKQYSCYDGNEQFTLIYSRPLRGFMRFMDYSLLRPFIWIGGWVWSFLTAYSFDAVIVPRDSKPFQHMIGAWKPTLVCQPGLGRHDKHYLRYVYTGDVPFPAPQVQTRYRNIDKYFGGSYLNLVRGAQDKKFYSVIGYDFKEFYQELGIPKDHIYVSGNPNYEGVTNRCDYLDIQRTLELDTTQPIYTFFSSQLFFTQKELDCLRGFLFELGKLEEKPLFIVKVHPRMSEDNINLFCEWASSITTLSVKIVADLLGDENNMRLISLSRVVCVEESNVGILSAWLQRPLLVMDLSGEKTYNIYTLFDGILDVSRMGNLGFALEQVTSPETCDAVLEAQNEMVQRISKRVESPNQKIVEIVGVILDSNK